MLMYSAGISIPFLIGHAICTIRVDNQIHERGPTMNNKIVTLSCEKVVNPDCTTSKIHFSQVTSSLVQLAGYTPYAAVNY